MDLVVATKNKKKLKEIKQIWKGMGLKVASLADYAVTPRIIENGKTFRENAIKKALKISGFTKQLTMGEDSGICINALGGKPGVYSARFAGKGKSDQQNNLKVLSLMKDLPQSKRKAHYVCAVALADKHGLVGVAEGKCFGRIGFEQKGSSGFGYDPLFLIPEYGKTFAQLGMKIKHQISHRYRALEKAKKILQKYIAHQQSR